MAIPKKISDFLKKSKVKYEIISHKTVYTALDKSATLKIKPDLIVKTLVLKGGKEVFLVNLPANFNLDKNRFKKLLNEWKKKRKLKVVKEINFLSENLIKKKFKGIKIGAVPPFGNLWRLPTFFDKIFLRKREIILNSGDHSFSIRISPSALQKLIPEIIWGVFSKKRK